MTGLRERVIRGIRWRGLADVSQVLLQVGFTAVLARLLGLADFGLAAMCLLYLRFVNALTNVGFGAAVIQSRDITPRQISGIFVIQLGIKGGVLAVSFAAAPLAARFFEQPQLTELIRVMAFVILFDGIAFPQTLARKALRFRGYSLLELGSLIAANALGIALALTGFGVWSLIARHIAEKVIYAIAIWPVVGWRPTRPAFRGVAPYLRFGFTLFASSTVYFFSQHLAAVIIGKFVGVEALGLYNVAYNLGVAPAQRVQSLFSTVLMPAFASLQSDLERLRTAIRQALFSIGAIFIPVMLGLAAIAPSFVVAVYGAKWEQAGHYLIILAAVGLTKGLEHLFRSVLIALAQPRSILIVSTVEACLSLPILWSTAEYFGTWGIVLAYGAVSATALYLTAFYVRRCLGSWSPLWGALVRSAVAGASMFIAILPIPYILSIEAQEALIIQVLAGVILYATLRWRLLTDAELRVVSGWPFIRKRFTAS